MDTDFWLKKWANNEIGFHLSAVNPVLAQYFHMLSIKKATRVFVPLCGKTQDISWLLGQGCRVVGAELSEMAIEQLFSELGVQPVISDRKPFKHYAAQDIDIFVGDVFDLQASILGVVDVIYDRAALVALPEKMRLRYTVHLMEITRNAPQFLIAYEYDQSVMDGPPFSISETEIRRHYGQNYDVTLIAGADVSGGLKGQCKATENVWLLQERHTP